MLVVRFASKKSNIFNILISQRYLRHICKNDVEYDDEKNNLNFYCRFRINKKSIAMNLSTWHGIKDLREREKERV